MVQSGLCRHCNGSTMKSIAALGAFNSFSANRLLRKEYITRLTRIVSIVLGLLSIGLLIWGIRLMAIDAISMSNDVTKLTNTINDRLATATIKSPEPQRKDLDYGRITSQQMFGKIGVVEAAPPPTPKAAPVSNVALKLIGTFIASGEDPTAIIEDTKKQGSQDVFGLNESIFGEAKLAAIFSDRVEIERGGKRETLMLDEGAAGGGAGAAESGGNTIVVDEKELDSALSNLPMLLTQARAVPYFKDGKSVGLRLFAIRRESLFEKIGLQNGDVLKEINGNSLNDITQAVKLFEKLKEQRDVAVTLMRQNEEQTFRYLIR